MTPVIGSILDRYVDMYAEDIFREVQSPDQLGFTTININYLMASVQRGECQSAKVPTLFDHPSDGYMKYFCFGWWCPMIAACRLGQKYKVSLSIQNMVLTKFQAEL